METMIHILHLEDDPLDGELVHAKLVEGGLAFRIARVETRDEFERALRQDPLDIILADYQLPTYDGMAALVLTNELQPDIPFIFVSGTLGEEAAIEALTKGATDYVLKFNLSRLAPAVLRALEEAHNRREHREAQEALRRSNDLLRAIIEATPVAIAGLDLEGRVRSVWNPAAEKMLGWSAQEVMGKPLPIVPADRREEFKRIRKQISRGVPLEGKEECHQRCDGTPIDYSIYASPLHDSQGQVTGNICVLVDITERKQAERERLANLRFFENMDTINRTIQWTTNLEKMMRESLNAVISIFDCDRAFLMYPCDPESATWSVPMECNKAPYPGVEDLKSELPMDPQVARTLRILLTEDGPVAFGAGAPHELPETVAKRFSIKSFMAMAIYPKIGSPWQFGIHQCAYARDWTAEEMRMFEAIGRRLADGLSSLLSYRDLRENEKFLDKVVEHIPDMIFVKDAQTLSFVRFNKAGEQLVGYPRKELLGKTDYDFFPKEEADFFTGKDRQVLDTKELLDIHEETIRTRGNEERILHTKKIPILDESGTPQYLLGISEDITERKKAEESIRKLTLAIEQSPVSIVITDVQGTIEFVNSAFTQITGYTSEEAIGRNPRILKSGETPAAEYGRLWQTISAGGVWQGEFRNRKKNGELFWEQATIAPVRDAADTITHYVAVKADITERKKLEEHLRQVQKMEAIGQLAGGIAHDFNNILSAITGYTELSKAILQPGSEPFEYLSQVMEASGRAKELINQILMFSRETAKELRPIRVAFPVKEALKLIRASVPSTVEIRSRIVSKSSALADPTQIHQIVMNLCTNAAQAMQESGGLLEVHLTDITVNHGDHHRKYPDAKPGDYIRLTVSDEGHGIDGQYLHRIFDPFFTTKKIGEGTGMGLSVVHGIIKSFGGFIYAHSQLGKGSTFELLIPTQESAAAHDAIMEMPIPTGGESILFVDDETMIVDIVRRMLQSLGYRVVARSSAMEALEAFKSNPDSFDLVITDMVMPKMTGLDLAEKIFEIRPGFPIVLCSGFDVGMNKEKIAKYGLQDIIYKPILRRDMATVVRKTLDSRRSAKGDI
jgi:PAS domain S-box-containing protein